MSGLVSLGLASVVIIIPISPCGRVVDSFELLSREGVRVEGFPVSLPVNRAPLPSKSCLFGKGPWKPQPSHLPPHPNQSSHGAGLGPRVGEEVPPSTATAAQ